jgi:hypothetical protein
LSAPLQTPDLPGELAFPRAALALALLAVIVGRGLGQALPGSLTGIDTAIDVVETAGAIISQLCAALLTAQALRTNLVVVFTQPGQLVLKFGSTLTTLLVAVTTLFAALLTQNQLAVSWAGLGAVAVAGTLAGSGALALRQTGLRGVGLIVLAVACASLAHTGARVLALLAAERASLLGFGAARALATAGFVFEVLCLGACWLWLLRPAPQWLRSAAATLAALALGAALLATREEGWGLVLGRTLEQLSAHPDPFIPTAARYALELWGLLTAALCLFTPQRSPALLMVLGLCLLGRSSADVPLGAVFLLNAALALQLGNLGPLVERGAAEVIKLSTRPRSAH